MAPRKQTTVQEPPTESPPAYELEPANDEIRSQLVIWGNATQMTINKLGPVAPGWAAFLNDIFQTVGGIMEVIE